MSATVILACYNGEKYIVEQLESIFNQDVRPDEVIICDDNSTDKTVEIVTDYIKKRELDTWRIIKNENNVGWKANFAKLVGLATKDIIFFCDQDDIWKLNKISTMSEILNKNADVKLLISDLDVQYMSANTQKYNPVNLGKKFYQHMKLKPAWLRIMRPGCVFAVERNFAQECFSVAWRDGLAHDLLLWQYAFVRNVIGYVRTPLITYRRFEESTTSGVIKSKLDFRIIENKIFLESLEAAFVGYEAKSRSVDRIVQRSYSLEKLRKEFFETKSIKLWLRCFMYFDCYPSKKSWLADYYYVRK